MTLLSLALFIICAIASLRRKKERKNSGIIEPGMKQNYDSLTRTKDLKKDTSFSRLTLKAKSLAKTILGWIKRDRNWRTVKLVRKECSVDCIWLLKGLLIECQWDFMLNLLHKCYCFLLLQLCKDNSFWVLGGQRSEKRIDSILEVATFFYSLCLYCTLQEIVGCPFLLIIWVHLAKSGHAKNRNCCNERT